jgi:hypothetical protein
MFWNYLIYKYRFIWAGDNKITNYYLAHTHNNWIWRGGYSGLYIDELYARIFEVVFRQIFILPAIFVLDKWVSHWMGVGFVKNILNWTSHWLYIDKLSLLNIINIMISTLVFSFILLNVLFCII